MKTQVNLDYKFSIHFNDSTHYPTEDVLRIISEATYYFQLCNMPEKRELAIHLGILELSSTDCKPSFDSSNITPPEISSLAHQDLLKEIYEKEEMRDLTYYYTDRLIKSIFDQQLELWDRDASKVIGFPIIEKDAAARRSELLTDTISVDTALEQMRKYKESILDGSFQSDYSKKPKNASIHSPLHQNGRYDRHYIVDEWWLRSSKIYKSDLVRFCKNQKIEALFDNHDQSSIIVDQDQAIEPEETIECTNQSVIPGKIPRISIGKLAIEIAWDIELDTGKFANASEVMKRLQQYAEEGKHSDFLQEKIPKGVTWLTNDCEQRVYMLDTCGRALREWKKSRSHEKNIDNSSSTEQTIN